MSASDAPPTADIPVPTAVENPVEPLSLKARIKQHYDLCSSYYYSLWHVAFCFSFEADPFLCATLLSLSFRWHRILTKLPTSL